MAAATNISVLKRQEYKEDFFTRLQLIQFTLDVPSVAGNSYSEDTATVPGLVVGKDVVLGWTHGSEPIHDLMQEIHVGAPDTLHILSHNSSGSPINPGVTIYRVVVGRLAI